MAKTWFITGATRGIGAAIASAALAAGDSVAASGRDPARIAAAFPDAGQALLPVALDVTDEAGIAAAVETTVAHFGRIDVLVNNAGFGVFGPFEETSAADAQLQFATNVFGLFAVTRAVLPVMRRQKAGHLFNLSSIAGLRGGLGGSLYAASKFAVEGFSESLAQEVAPFGIHVTVVEPGFFRTDFLDGSSVRLVPGTIGDYAETSQRIRDGYQERNHNQAGDPAKLGTMIVTLAGRDDPPFRYAAGTDAAGIMQAKIDRLTRELAAIRDIAPLTDGDF